jgi:vacuolar-type H+-ATPase subunit H
MKQDILAKLQSAESHSADGISKAQGEAQRLVRDARQQATQTVAKAHEDARAAADAQVAAERSKLEAQRKKILDAGKAKEATLRKQYEAKVAATVQKAVKTFEESL